MKTAKWECPVCKAVDNKCGTPEKAIRNHERGTCTGLVCECEAEQLTKEHGESDDDPCPYATCYHCGWGGTLPIPKYKFKGWAKKAWDAGWRPPQGWEPPDDLIAK